VDHDGEPLFCVLLVINSVCANLTCSLVPKTLSSGPTIPCWARDSGLYFDLDPTDGHGYFHDVVGKLHDALFLHCREYLGIHSVSSFEKNPIFGS
jgi:hypothetical protein